MDFKKRNQGKNRIYKIFAMLLLCLVFIYSLPITAFAATSGPNNAGTGTDVTGVGTFPWSNPGNITADDLQYASRSVGSNGTSYYLEGTNYGFAIPTTARIDGITVAINREQQQSPGVGIYDNIVSLLKAGTVVGNNKAATTAWPMGSFSTATYGSAADLWGTTWMPADINATNFGVALSINNTYEAARTPRVDYMQITVNYTIPSTTVGDGTSPANKTVMASATNKAVSAFTLNTNFGTDTVSGLVVTGTNTGNVAANGVKLYLDNGSIPNEWDASDTLVKAGSFSGTTATFTGLSVPITTTSTQYIITFDLTASPSNGNTMTVYVSSVTAGNTVTNNDNTDATLTVDTILYTVSFDSQGGSAVGSRTATYDTTISAPADPSRTGYIFGGWYKETGCVNAWNFTSDKVTSDLALYAKWTIETLEVVFDSQGGSAVGSITANHGSMITAPADPSRTGYTFEAWYKEPGCVNAWNFTSDTVTSHLALYAKWTINSYTVTFEDWDATVLKTQTVEYNTDATPPADPVRTGYTFTGWSGSYSNVAGDTSITANFTQDEYALAVNIEPADSGSVIVDPLKITYHYGDVITLTPVASDGWAFTFWSGDISRTDNPLTVTIYGDIRITANFTKIFKLYLPVIMRN